MTYQEIKDRLSKCELTLEKLKSSANYSKPEMQKEIKKLTVLKETYEKHLNEKAKKTAFIDGRAVDIEDKDDLDKFKDNSDIDSIETGDGKKIKENEGTKFSVDETKSIAKKVGKAVAQSLRDLGDAVHSMKAKRIEENSFEIEVNYKGQGPSDEFSFYITDDTLHLTDFSFDKELVDVGVKPSGEAIVHVDHLANELTKHFKSINEDEEEDAKNDADYERGWTDDPRMDEAPDNMYYIKVPKTDKGQQNAVQNVIETFYSPVRFADIVDDDGAGNVIMYIRKEDFQEGMIDDLSGEGVDIDSQTNFPTMNEDKDIGHQDDEPNMLGASAMETAEYAAKLVKKLQRYDQHDGEVDFPNWWQKKLILARDYISAAYHYLDSEEKQPAIDQLALENVDKVAGGIPYKREGNKFIITEPLDDATKERIMKRAKEHGHHAAPNQAGGITIMAKEGVNENRFLAASMEDLEQVIRNLAHTGEMSEDEAIELAIRKLEAMLDGRDDMDEGRKDDDALYPDNPRLPEIKNLADKIVSMVKAEAAKGELGYIKTMEEIRYQQEDDFERTPEWNKAKGIKADFDDYGSGTNEGLAKTQKAHGLVVAKMKELAKQYKAGDTSVVAQLKDLTAKKKSLEAMLDKDVAGTGRDQELEEAGPGFKHDCAAKVVHEKYGAGNCIPEKHTLVKEGKKFVVTHYDVLFESGKTVTDIPVSELEIKTQNEHWHKGYKKKKKD